MARPSKHLTTWPHPWPKYAKRITLMTGIQPGNAYIYADFFDAAGDRLTTNPLSLRTQDKGEAEQNAVEALGRVIASREAGVPTGRPIKRDQFGTVAKFVMADLEAAAAKHGITRPGEYRDALLGPDAAELNRHEAFHAACAALENSSGNPGKGRSPLVKHWLIRAVLLPRWANTPISEITAHALNQWVIDHLRTQKGKQYAEGSLSQIDTAFASVYKRGLKDGLFTSDVKRPSIDYAEHGLKTKRRSFFTEAEMTKLAAHIKRQWATASFEQRLIYLYIALMTCSAIRAGLEMLSTRLSQINVAVQYDQKRKRERPVTQVDVDERQGKIDDDRKVTVFVGPELHFPILAMLDDVKAQWRAILPDSPNAYLFGEPGASKTVKFGRAVQKVYQEVGILFDPTGKRRVAYCLRHYFATVHIQRGVNIYKLAQWMGTSIKMIDKHYSHYIHAADGWKLDGYQDPGDDLADAAD